MRVFNNHVLRKHAISCTVLFVYAVKKTNIVIYSVFSSLSSSGGGGGGVYLMMSFLSFSSLASSFAILASIIDFLFFMSSISTFFFLFDGMSEIDVFGHRLKDNSFLSFLG